MVLYKLRFVMDQ